MKTIFTLFPEMLNLNGDSANSFVLQKNFEWMGEQAQTVSVATESQLLELLRLVKSSETGIFVTIGHGSAAAMQALAAHDALIRDLLEAIIESKTPAIVVGSALKWANVNAGSKSDRRSEFVVATSSAEDWPSNALGYLNSDLELPPVSVESNVILTLLHGPFFAKNPSWVERVIRLMGAENSSSESKEVADGFVEEIWRLEANH